MTYRKYTSTLAAMAFFFVLLLTGCAKDELIPPAGDDALGKSIELSDVKGDDTSEVDALKNSDKEDFDGITDDEDDEDDNDRSTNR
jgi:hypothetical protein